MNLFIGFVLLWTVGGTTQNVVRQTQYGQIRGLLRTSRTNSSVQFYHFLGVPYARAPVGRLRFKEARPPVRWTGIRDATSYGDMCIQLSSEFSGTQVLGSEDCLTLDIAVPKTAGDQQNLPVMVWIHGGGFLFAASADTQADPFMEQPVVVVNIQYRLSVFGFLSTGDDNAPGNMGLKDQTFALKWIKNNIRNFGGDPNLITIFGGSGGGSAVQFHLLSPRSEGLFHRAISQSGVTLNTWVFQSKPKEKLRQLAQAFGFDHTKTRKLVAQLQGIPADVLLKTAFNQSITGPYLLYDEVPFLPSIEHDSPTAFISSSAFKLLEEGKFSKVPYLIGQVEEEGSYPYHYIDSGFIDIQDFEDKPQLFVPISMNIPEGHRCINDTVDAIHRFFFHNGPYTDKENWIAMMGQDVRGFQKSADLICANFPNHPIYYYEYTFVGTNNMSFAGRAGHYSEVLKLFHPVYESWSTTMTDADRDIQKKLVKLWTNFAYYGNPTPEPDELLQNVQLPTFCNGKPYLEINTDLVVKHNPSEDVYRFWEDIYQQCGFPPYTVY